MNQLTDIRHSSLKNNKNRREGLTLVELLVVLTVIIAVAGIGVSILPNIQQRTHGSTSAVSIRDVEARIESNLFSGAGLGTDFDGLIAADNTIPAFIGNANGFAASGALDDDQVAALADLGITTYFQANATPDDDNATFGGHNYGINGANVQTISNTSQLAELPAAKVTEVSDAYNTAEPENIFVFGLGQESTLVGLNRTFKEAPIHFPAEGNAATTYSRYAILVGYVDNDPANAGGGEAFYIATTCIDDGENFNNIQGNLGEYFEAL